MEYYRPQMSKQEERKAEPAQAGPSDPRKELLPRCPACGTATGYDDERCHKCGLALKQAP
jgi:uncharacterized OB-fold protein